MRAKTFLLIASLLFMAVAISAELKEENTETNQVADKEQENKEQEHQDEDEETDLTDSDRELEEDTPTTDLAKEVKEEDLTEVEKKAWVSCRTNIYQSSRRADFFTISH